MAITSIGTCGTVGASGAGTSFQLTTATNALSNSGDIGFLEVVSDNVSTTDGNSNDHTSVTGGNGVWTKIYEQTNTVGGAAGDGVCVSLWKFRSTGANAVGTVFTINHASTGDRCASMWKFTVGAGNDLYLALAPHGYTTDGANGFGSNTISGLSSASRLYLAAYGKEANSTTGLTVSASFTEITGTRSRNNGNAVLVRGEFRINTSTGETANPTLAVSGDNAMIFAALFEGAPLTQSLSDDVNNLADALGKTLGQRLDFSDSLTPTATSIWGFDFRATSTFVTDPADHTYDIGENYPVTRNGVTFGWTTATPGSDKRDRSTGVDARLAGIVFLTNNGSIFPWRLDLPNGPGVYRLRLALGDGAAGNPQKTYLVVKDDSIPVLTFNPASTGGSQFADAAGNVWSPANWPANNVGIDLTFTTGILRLDLGGTDSDSSCIAHLSIEQVSSGFQDSVITDLQAGSPDLTRTFSDTVDNLADAVAITAGIPLSLSDNSNNLADGNVAVAGIPLTHSDSLTNLTDALVKLLSYELAFADSEAANWADAHQLLLAQFLALADNSFNLGDAAAVVLEERELFTDSFTLADAAVVVLGYSLLASDSVNNLTDSYNQTQDQLKTFSGSLALVDTLALGYGLLTTDTTTVLTDAYAQTFHEVTSVIEVDLGDSLSFDDALALGIGLLTSDLVNNLADSHALNLSQLISFSDTLTLTDIATLTLGQRVSFNDSLSLTDSESHTLGYDESFSDSVNNLADSSARNLGELLQFSDSVDNLADARALSLSQLLNFSDSLALTDSLALLLHYSLFLDDDINTFVDLFVSNAPQAPGLQVGMTDALAAFSDEVTLRLGYQLAASDAITLTDAFSANGSLLTSFSDSLTLTDAETATLAHLQPLADSFLLNDSIQLRLAHALSVTDTVTINDSTTLNLNHLISLADNVALLADSLAKSVGLSLIITDNVQALSDAISLFGTGSLTLADTLALNDSLALSRELGLSDQLTLTDDFTLDLRGPDFNLAIADSFALTDAITLSLGNELQLQLLLNDVVTLVDHYFDLRHPYTPSAKRHIVVPSRARVTTVTGMRVTRVPSSGRTTKIE